MNDKHRHPDFERNLSLEKLLNELNTLLSPIQEKIEAEIEGMKYPLVMIVGAPRSGTTLMKQWICSLGVFSYPSNLISRFYKAPYLGARIQQLIFEPEFDFMGELLNKSYSEDGFQSDVGKTRGPLAPHEFWYYWFRFFTMPDVPISDEEFMSKADFDGFTKGLASVETVFDQPLVVKGLIANWYLHLFDKYYDKIIFIHTHRDPIKHVESLRRARERYFGTDEHWYAFRPREFEQIKGLDLFGQIAGQIHFTNEEVKRQFEQIEDNRKISIPYEDFCANPKALYTELRNKLAAQGFEMPAEYNGPSEFTTSKKSVVSPERKAKIEDAYALVRSLAV